MAENHFYQSSRQRQLLERITISRSNPAIRETTLEMPRYPSKPKSSCYPLVESLISTNPHVRAKLLRSPLKIGTESTAILMSMDEEVITLAMEMYHRLTGKSYRPDEYHKEQYASFIGDIGDFHWNILRARTIIDSCLGVVDGLFLAHTMYLDESGDGLCTNKTPSLQECLINMQWRNDTKVRHIQNLIGDLEDRDMEIATERKRVNTLEYKLRKAETQLNKQNEDFDTLMTREKQMKAELKRAEEQIMKLKTEKEEQTKIVSSVYETTSDLKQDESLTSIQNASTELYQRCVELDTENKTLKMELKQIKNKPITREADIHHLNQRKQYTIDDIRDIQSKYIRSQNEITRLHKCLNNYENEIRQYAERFKRNTPEKTQSEAKIRKQTGSSLTARQQGDFQHFERLDAIEGKNTELEKHLKHANETIRGLDSENTRLKQRLMIKEDCTKAKACNLLQNVDHNIMKTDRKTEFEKQRKTLEYKLKDFTKQIDELTRERNNLQMGETELDKKRKELHDTLQSYEKHVDELIQDRDKLQTCESELKQQYKELKETLESYQKQVEELNQDRDKRQNRYALMDTVISQLKQSLVESNNKANKLEYQNQQLHGRMKELQTQNTNLEERLMKSQQDRQENVKMRQRFRSFETKKAELEQQLMREKGEVARLDREKNQLQERSHSLGSEHNDLRQQLLREKEKITRLEYENNQLIERNKNLIAAKKDCNDKYLQCANDVESAKKEKANLETGMKELQKKNTELEERLKHSQEYNQENDELRQRFRSFETKKAELEQQLMREKEEVARLDREKNQLQERSHSLGSEHTDLRKQLSREKEKITRLEYENNQLQERNKNLIAAKKDCNDKYLQCADDVESAKKEKANLKTGMKELQKKNTELEKRLKHSQEYHQENDELRQRFRSFETKKAELEQQLMREKEEVARLDREKNQLQERSHSLGSELNDLRKQLSREKEKITRLEYENNQLQERNKNLIAAKKDCNDKYLQCADDVESAKKEKANLETGMKELQKKNNELEERLKHSQEYHQENDELRQRFRSFETKKAELEQQLMREKEEVARLDREKNQLQERSYSLGSEHTDLRKQLLREKEKITRLEYENNQLQERNKNLTAAKKDCYHKYLQCADDVESAKKEKANLETGMKELQKKNNELEERLKHSQEYHQENDELRQRLLDLQKHSGRLDSSVKNANDKCKQLQQEKDDLLNRITNLKTEKKDFTDRYLQCAENAESAKKENTKLDARMKELRKRNTELEERLQHLQEDHQETDELRQRGKELQKQNTELEERLKHSQKDHKENDELCQRLLELQKHNERLDFSVTSANDRCRQLQQEKDDLINSITNLETEKKDFTDRYLQCAEDAESIMKEKTKLDARMKELRKRNTELEERLQHLQEDHQETDELRQRLLDLQKQNGRLDSRVKDANDRCRHLEQEKDALLTRLSQYTSAQLVHDNPNVADLSDLNRPTKLAEKYSELYDNEWTDAFEVLIEQYSFSEEKAINHLLQIVRTAYTYCSETAKQQVEMLKKALVDPFAGSRVMSSLDLDPVQIRLIQDLRKQTSKHSIESVKKGFIHHLKSQLKHSDPSSISTYVEKCAELCWYMVLPTPPLFISSSDHPDDTFDKNKYRFYQTSGTKYTFIVWPALYLYKDGNILAKGIAEASE